MKRDLPNFDPREWYSLLPPFEPGKYGGWSTRDVIGPRDACWILRMREILLPHISFGSPAPLDLFILAIGEAPTPYQTKIGGLPYWPRNREWPRSDTGESLPFLAQFNFSESLDIVSDLPEHLLLLFGHQDDPAHLVARWQSLACHSRLVDRDDGIPADSRLPMMYGTRWRTEAYPAAQCDSELTLPNGDRIYDIPLVCRPLGMQIGNACFVPGWGEQLTGAERPICSMSSIFPIPGFPYAFANRPEPLREHECEDLVVELSEIRDADGFGVVCAAIHESGETTVLFENM